LAQRLEFGKNGRDRELADELASHLSLHIVPPERSERCG
jgi:hypothetical protein